MKPKAAAEKAVDESKKGEHPSERLITYLETERRVEDWGEENIHAILNCRKVP